MEENIKWLLENGGTAIKLRMINEGLIDSKKYDVNKMTDEILQIENINKGMAYFDLLKGLPLKINIPYRQYAKENRDLIHGCYEDCLEMYMSFFIRLGFKKGITVFDKNIKNLTDLYPVFLNRPIEKGGSSFIGVIIINLLLWAGYYFIDMEDFLQKRLDEVHKVTKTKEFDFYENDTAKIRQIKKWKDFLILKDKYNPFIDSEFPLPIIYDVETLFRLYKYLKNDKSKQKIDDIARFILEPQYQKTKGDYGWVWSANEKTYHASTGGVCLPLYDSDELEVNRFGFINILELMTLSPVVKKSNWFKKCIKYLEQYKTERGTYIFPDDLLSHITYHAPAGISVLYDVFISKDVLPLMKKNQRKIFAYELYSTFFMVMLKNRLQCIKQLSIKQPNLCINGVMCKFFEGSV